MAFPVCLLEPEQSHRAALSPQVSGPALVSPVTQSICPHGGGNADRSKEECKEAAQGDGGQAGSVHTRGFPVIFTAVSNTGLLQRS